VTADKDVAQSVCRWTCPLRH